MKLLGKEKCGTRTFRKVSKFVIQDAEFVVPNRWPTTVARLLMQCPASKTSAFGRPSSTLRILAVTRLLVSVERLILLRDEVTCLTEPSNEPFPITVFGVYLELFSWGSLFSL
ncbi:hypothetical protein KSS87_008235 [Heliosperma pusillum]|nr:hypothetical protein KSS87_008235 [Heliosperma pusillum]